MLSLPPPPGRLGDERRDVPVGARSDPRAGRSPQLPGALGSVGGGGGGGGLGVRGSLLLSAPQIPLELQLLTGDLASLCPGALGEVAAAAVEPLAAPAVGGRLALFLEVQRHVAHERRGALQALDVLGLWLGVDVLAPHAAHDLPGVVDAAGGDALQEDVPVRAALPAGAGALPSGELALAGVLGS